MATNVIRRYAFVYHERFPGVLGHILQINEQHTLYCGGVQLRNEIRPDIKDYCGDIMDDYLSVSLLPNSSYATMKANRSNMLGAGISNNKVKYSRLAADDDGYIDLQVRDFFFGNSVKLTLSLMSHAAL